MLGLSHRKLILRLLLSGLSLRCFLLHLCEEVVSDNGLAEGYGLVIILAVDKHILNRVLH